ncbi:MAG: hypothetical protein EDM75_13425, partial [Chlorobiota bacterium]
MLNHACLIIFAEDFFHVNNGSFLMSRSLFLLLFLISIQIITGAQGYICAVGGGGENNNDWSDAPYSWIVQKSGYGKVIVLSVNDETSWIPNYFVSKGASHSSNLKINSRTLANSQAIYDSIFSASAVFIK